ncbi:M24 family metallopeptidase [Paenirhodobacter sp.]|uniref:M24 family metallopeptidase n=1 Tax=Paenirhodobacter sp. TaxID=1965326 RepID=UPI003B3C2950
MTIINHDELEGLKHIGRIVANTMQVMAKAMNPGMTTRELDEIGRAFLDRKGAVSARQSTYDLPGAACIRVNEEIAHGIPGDRVIVAGDLVNIDEERLFRRYRRDISRRPGAAPTVPQQQVRHADRHGAGGPQQAVGRDR